MKLILLAAPLALVFTACATKAPSAEQAAPLSVVKTDAALPFAHLRRQIDDWTVRTDGSLLIKSSQKKYYHATFLGACPGLELSTRIAFEPNPTGELDKFSSVRVEGYKCVFKTFDEVADPRPPKAS